MKKIVSKIMPCLWFDTQAKEAANYYVSIFGNSKVKGTMHYGEAAAKVSGMPAGSVLTVTFELEGQEFVALNGGPVFKFTEAISLMVNCETQQEIDRLWEKLTAGGDPAAQQCGWLKDKFGVSWQIVPTVLDEMLQDSDPEKAERVMTAFLPMKKIDISVLQKAYELG